MKPEPETYLINTAAVQGGRIGTAYSVLYDVSTTSIQSFVLEIVPELFRIDELQSDGGNFSQESETKHRSEQRQSLCLEETRRRQ